ncbi:MAG TPA: hypothetical protein VF665_19635 [Longimicrobium sp.]|jgi:hypothetical protein|uniref:hypothetical protein n=1 Tax=Longimicrobium sp. TaxID=2029185 RepID=UPI002EDA01C4
MSERKKMVTAEEIEEAALELDEGEFHSLVDRLTQKRGLSPERLRLWVEEAKRRDDAVADGRMGLVDADLVLADPDEDG